MENMVYIKIMTAFIMVGISSFATYLGINVEALSLFALLLVIDYITGIAKAKRLKENITSNKMKYGIVSKLLLLIIPLVLAICSKAMSIDISSLMFVAINMLVLSEGYSILGNIYAFRTAKELPEIEVVAILGKRIRSFLLALAGDK